MLFVSKYNMNTQRWAGKLPPHSARPNWRHQAQALPSSITSWMQISWTWWLSSACLCCENHIKSSPSVLSKSCWALQRNYLLFDGLCVSWYPPPAASRRTMTFHCTAPYWAMCASGSATDRCWGQPITPIASMVIFPTMPEKYQLSPPQPHRRAWQCPPMLLTVFHNPQ